MNKKKFIQDNVGFVELLEVFGDDITVVDAARVSFYKQSKFETCFEKKGETETKLSDRDAKLINYLAQHDHVTPFFHPMLRFRIKMPIFVVREWYRHVIGFARNEVSRRYVTDKPDFFVPEFLRERNVDVKQGSCNNAVKNNDALIGQMKKYYEQALKYYYKLLDEEKVCPEQARMILPQSMYTEFIETASLAAYARLVRLRLDKGAQKEIRNYAGLIAQLITPKFPVSWQALVA
jgi:thymidylate synthase (FAD)